MTFKLARATRETVSTTGAIDVTDVLDLGGVTDPHLQTFVASVGDANQTIVRIISGDNTAWMEAVVTVIDGTPDTLTIDDITASSAAGAGITLTSSSRVFGIIPTDWDDLFDRLYGTGAGSILRRTSGGGWSSLARGAVGAVLRSGDTDVEWQYTTQKESVVLVSTDPLPGSPVYDNGTSGTGATLTATSNGPLVVDGVTATTTDVRVIVAGQVDATENGVFNLTQLGVVGSSPYILTRSTDWDGDTVAAGGVQLGDTFAAYEGVSNIGIWAFSSHTISGAVVFGTDELTFTKIASVADITEELPAPGTDGDVLTLVAGAPAWVPPSGGGGAITLVGTLTASNSAALDFTGLTGTHWRLVGKFLRPVTDGVNSLIRFGTGAGPTYLITGYYAGGNRNGVTVSSTAAISSTNVNGWYLGQSQENTGNLGQGQSFVLDIVTDNANWVHITGIIIDHASADGHTRMGSIGGIRSITAQLTALRYLEDSGNVQQGTLSLYAVDD